MRRYAYGQPPAGADDAVAPTARRAVAPSTPAELQLLARAEESAETLAEACVSSTLTQLQGEALDLTGLGKTGGGAVMAVLAFATELLHEVGGWQS
eukprot:COSAG01_NODE_15943_length_1284_cov_1.383122_2_plen_96_part_00